MKKKPKRRKFVTPRQMKLVREVAKGKSLREAAIAAGYPEKNAAQSGFQAMQGMRGRVPELLDRKGLGEDVLIDKYLKPLLDAHETKFFNDGNKRINVEALGIRLAALRTAFELHGSYAPRDPKEAAAYGVKMIVMDMPRPSRYIEDVGPTIKMPPTNGSPKNGDKT